MINEIKYVKIIHFYASEGAVSHSAQDHFVIMKSACLVSNLICMCGGWRMRSTGSLGRATGSRASSTPHRYRSRKKTVRKASFGSHRKERRQKRRGLYTPLI
jgi:hypothetical protein